MTIRKATIQDRDQLIHLIEIFDEYTSQNVITSQLATFTQYKNKIKTFEEVADEYLTDSKYFLFVAEEENKLVGYICGNIEEKPHKVLNREGYIKDWFMCEEYRGGGVGMQLFEKLLNIFREQNCNRLVLKSFATNTKALNLYHKLGFQDMTIELIKKLE